MIQTKDNGIKTCPKCGQELERKLIGDEFYEICEDCGLTDESN